MLDERRGTLPIAASDGFSKRFLRIISLPEGDSISPMFDEIRETGRPLYTRDDQAAARARNAEFAAVFASEGVVSALRLPIFQPGGGVVGLLGLYHRHERLYTESEVRAAQAFTDQIAVALHNARLAQNEREAQAVAKRQVDQLGALTRVTEQLLASSNVDTVVRVLAKAAVELSSATGAVVALVRPGEQMLELAATYGDFQRWFDSFPATNLEIADLSRWATGKAIRTGQTVFVPDYLQEAMERPVQQQAGQAGLRALIAAPLRKGDTLLGMIWVGHKKVGGLTAEDALLLDALAEQGALALEQARLMEESHTLQVIAAELASTRETGALLEGIAERSMTALSADGGSVWLLDDEQRRPILAAAAGLSRRFFEAVQAVMVDDPQTGAALYEMARSRQEPGYFADDVGTVRGISERMANEFASEGIVSSLRLPLTDPSGVVVGMLVLHHRRERLYSESEVRLAQAFTDQIAVALHNAHLAEKERDAQAALRRQAERLSLLVEVTEELLASSEVGSVVRVVAASAVRLCGARAAVVALVRPGQRKLLKAVTHGDLTAWFNTFTETNLNEAYAMRTGVVEAIENGETLLISDYAAQALEQPRQRETAAAGVRSLVIAPLRKGDVLRGVLWVAATEPGALTDEDALLMRSLADQAALALEQARLIEESHALQVISAEVASARDATAMLDGIVRQTMTALSADGCAVWLADQERGQLRLAAMAGLSTRFQRRAQSIIEADEQMAAAALRSVAAMTRPVYSPDRVAEVRDASDQMAEALKQEGIVGTLRLPLFEPEGASVGMLALYHQHERLYSDGEVRLAQAFTDQIAVALHNASLAEKEREAQAVAKRQLERLQTITRITERLLAATEFSTVLRVVVEAAGRLCDASGTIVGLIDDEGKRLSAVAGEGEPRRYFEQFTTPVLDDDFYAGTATGQALAQRAPVVVEDYAAWPTRHWSQQETVDLGVRAFVVAPLLVGGMPIGALWVNDVKPRSFQP
ncbi:MAG: GAF domain-containing protein, partial [Dehalococcoidia bacterium]